MELDVSIPQVHLVHGPPIPITLPTFNLSLPYSDLLHAILPYLMPCLMLVGDQQSPDMLWKALTFLLVRRQHTTLSAAGTSFTAVLQQSPQPTECMFAFKAIIFLQFHEWLFPL